ncbi:MAG: hypothetical protein K2J37_00745 [Ruminococcus sp.]|nr:hypothetical protein [Ruminococcus sp.]MDE6784938.1 hypothetical protein [Ruminococcus sp.]
MARPRKNAVKSADTNKAVDTVEITAESNVETVEVPAAEEAETGKKTAAKKTTKKTAADKKQAEKKETAEKTTRKSAVKANIFIQYLGAEVSSADLVEKAKTDSGVKSPKTVNIYVKPEENMVYYVVDDKSGSYQLA